jgi:hypothetical protein
MRMLKFSVNYRCLIFVSIQMSSVVFDQLWLCPCVTCCVVCVEDGTDVPKHVGVVKERTLRHVCNLGIDLVLQVNVKQNELNE